MIKSAVDFSHARLNTAKSDTVKHAADDFAGTASQRSVFSSKISIQTLHLLNLRPVIYLFIYFISFVGTRGPELATLSYC